MFSSLEVTSLLTGGCMVLPYRDRCVDSINEIFGNFDTPLLDEKQNLININ